MDPQRTLLWNALGQLDSDRATSTQALDALRGALEALQGDIRDMRLGVEASAPLEPGKELAWRTASRGRLTVETSAGSQLLDNCSLEVRLRALEAVPELLTRMGEAARARTQRVQEATRTAQKIREVIRNSKEPPA